MTETIYLASWPRSGNTLLRAILWQCFGIKSSSMHGESLLMQKGCRELVGAELGPCRVIKTHCLPRDVPKTAKVIYLVRDGRDACVSYWHYYQDILQVPSATLRKIIEGKCMFGSWSDHVREWHKRNPVYLGFEDLRMPFGTVSEIAFASMVPLLGILPQQGAVASWEIFHNAHPLFFRSGKVGGWRNELKGDDLALFYDLHGDTMRQYGYTR